MGVTSMSNLPNKKTTTSVVDLGVQKVIEIDEKMISKPKIVDDEKARKKTETADPHAAHPNLNHKVMAYPDQERAEGNNGFVNFKTKIGMIFAM